MFFPNPIAKDGFGFLLFSRESVADVNAKLRERGVGDLQVEERRFRPNILVKGKSLQTIFYKIEHFSFQKTFPPPSPRTPGATSA